MQLLINIFVFLTFFMVPFLGENHLPLYYISIDRFWIEGTFGLLLIISITLSFLRNKYAPSGLFKYFLFFLPFFAFSVLSLFYSWNSFNTILWTSILVWSIGCIYLFALSSNKDVCFAGLITGAVFISISAMLQMKILFPNLSSLFQQGLYAQILREQSGIPFGSYMYHNILGGYLAFIFPLAIYFGVYKKSMLSLCASVLIALGVVITSTRIGFGIMILMFMIIVVALIFERRKQDLLKIGMVAIISTLSIWAVFYQAEKNHNVPGATAVIALKAKTVTADLSTLNTRTDIWKNALNAFWHSPIVGFGAGSFEYSYRKYFDGNCYTRVAHSTLIKIAVELGVIGLVCFFFYLVGVGFMSLNCLREVRYRFIFLSICAGILFSLVDFSFDVKSHIISFFLLSSVFFLSASPYLENTSKTRFSGRGFVTFLALIACLVINFYFSIRINEFKTSLQNGDLMVESGLPLNALYPYREAIDKMPLSNEGYIRALSVLLQIYPVESKHNLKESMLKEIKEYIAILEGKKDKDSEVFFILGKIWVLIGDTKKVDKYFGLALNYYPSSGYYIYEIAHYYASKGKYDSAMKVLRSFDPFIEKHRGPHNPRGTFVYLIRDLEAEINYKIGNKVEALRIAQNNLQDAKNGIYVTTSARSRHFSSRESLLNSLKIRVEEYENNRS